MFGGAEPVPGRVTLLFVRSISRPLMFCGSGVCATVDDGSIMFVGHLEPREVCGHPDQRAVDKVDS